MFEQRSALEIALRAGGCDGANGRGQLRIGEVRGRKLIQISGFATTVTDLETLLSHMLEVDLPAETGKVLGAEECSLFKIGPEQYWVVASENDGRLRSIQASVTDGIGAITPLASSRACIYIDGPAAREILGKGIALDFSPETFLLGDFALTGLHHTPVMLHRSGTNRYELYVLRTFAASVWDWIIDASLPYGYALYPDL